MTQFQHTLKALLEGRKTETSRIALPEPDGTGEYDCEMLTYPGGQLAVSRMKKDVLDWKHIWIVGKDYAIQPARGVRSVGRYRVEAIWRQDVRTLTLGQVDAEGFEYGLWPAFWETWCRMHDPSMFHRFRYASGIYRGGPLIKADLMERPAERYQAWRMTIKVLWDTVNWDAPAVRALQITKPGL